MTSLAPFTATSGPKPARILLLGEAWGESESQVRKPFVGESGKELWRMLGEAWPDLSPELHAEASKMFQYGSLAWVGKREAWLREASVAMTNVFALRPQNNKIETLCCKKAELPKDYPLPMLSQGNYVRPEYFPELDRLFEEIRGFDPNIIIPMGNTACWAILQKINIGSIRGTVASTIPI